ncbi:uncharacterized protein LOC134697150 [Mytilus trossulus]|uniref:uncharacterized protein LOC134697150 n=1 Tax=Mytilus trossulus TaxID=6551 RepID=UPI00300659D3
MIHSQKYSKVRQRNSYTVSYAQHGEICYGEVLFFAEVVDPEIDESSAYAFVKGYVKKDMNLVADLTTNLKTYGLLIFEKERQDGIRLVRLEKINQKIVLMESEHMFIGGIFPNFYEKD